MPLIRHAAIPLLRCRLLQHITPPSAPPRHRHADACFSRLRHDGRKIYGLNYATLPWPLFTPLYAPHYAPPPRRYIFASLNITLSYHYYYRRRHAMLFHDCRVNNVTLHHGCRRAFEAVATSAYLLWFLRRPPTPLRQSSGFTPAMSRIYFATSRVTSFAEYYYGRATPFYHALSA